MISRNEYNEKKVYIVFDENDNELFLNRKVNIYTSLDLLKNVLHFNFKNKKVIIFIIVV